MNVNVISKDAKKNFFMNKLLKITTRTINYRYVVSKIAICLLKIVSWNIIAWSNAKTVSLCALFAAERFYLIRCLKKLKKKL